LSVMGISFPDSSLGDLLEEIKNLSVGGKEISDIELAAIAENLLWRGRSEEYVKLDEFVVLTGKNVTPTATVTVTVDGVSKTCAMTGHGPVDAAVNAIRAAMDNRISFEELRLESITGGSDSLCEVTVLVKDTVSDGHISAGKAVGIDIVDTTVDAFMQAINRDYARSR
ncbi:MAG: 2-isopropylmalate synthase, partial [Candidatus Methanomethylophilaceae archaeon]|nr:2-isopropylmalate synthase [Candidatus Methanomethylophilaceae archaeon]